MLMPHNRPQHVVCKNTHDLLDNGLTRSHPFHHSVFATQIFFHWHFVRTSMFVPYRLMRLLR